ncbi:MAG TPA: hypothetical protein VOA64_18115 [Candidatus Dormibacteraeota bacterium]|nr:hypothetical protein [Candidatus Dormibacteraeota bacterium]
MNTIRLRLRYFGIAFLACGPFLGTPLLAQDYPLAAGTRWTYHLRKEVGPGVHFDGEDARVAKNNIVDTTIVAQVAGTDQIGGKTYTRVESHREGKLANVDWFALTPQGLMHSKTVDYLGGGQTELNPPERMLSPALAPQETWIWQDSQSEKTSRTTALAPEQISVPAGTYRAIPVRMETSVPTDGEPVHMILTQWFAPGVGYVKYEVRIEIAGHLLMHNTGTLEKFEHAPAQ